MTKFSTDDGSTVLHIDLTSVYSDDPLAYAYGFFSAYSGVREDRSIDTAAAYTAGFAHGRSVVSGDITMPIWASLTH